MSLTFGQFLKLAQVLKILYGRQVACAFFEKNLDNFDDIVYNRDIASLI